MSKKTKQGSVSSEQKVKQVAKVSSDRNSDYLWSMSMAPRLEQGMHWFQMLPAAFFTAFIIMIVRMYTYERPMNQFYWITGGNDLIEFFSYYKMVAIVICTVFALVFLLYRAFSQSLFIKRSIYYIPMAVYAFFVLISYFMSDYKEFALWGYNDRFEGTITLLCYMVMLFFVINTVNNEQNVKLIVYPLAISSTLLSLLGLTQALDIDFFQTTLGKKLITPNWFWDQLDSLTFTFQNQEIYQTVYNINYVSFYLTLLIPLFGLLFIHSVMDGQKEHTWKKVLWGMLFALTMYNLIGSQSSGGIMGMAAVVLVALVLLNKLILTWWKPVLILLAITIGISGITYERWLPELSGAISSVLGVENKLHSESLDNPSKNEATTESTIKKGYIDYIETKGNDIIVGYEGNGIIFKTYPDNPLVLQAFDSNGNELKIKQQQSDKPYFKILDDRFSAFTIGPAKSEGVNYFLLQIDEHEWPFAIIPGNDVLYRNDLGHFVSLKKVPAIGWADNQSFGSGRGYIWSRTLPMMKDTIFVGHGADTYCLFFPHDDYVGKYNADWNINMIVDKPHNMYMGSWVGTGGISVLALLAMWVIYLIQSIRLLWGRKFSTFVEYSGLGIFLGICGFLVSGLVDDSTVSVMPMFYGLLGTGIAINMILQKAAPKKQ